MRNVPLRDVAQSRDDIIRRMRHYGRPAEVPGSHRRESVYPTPDATAIVDELVVLARRAVHPHYVVEGMLTYCQCPTCGRVERVLRRVAADAERGMDDALADTALATRDATQGAANVARAVHDRDAADAEDRALVQQWREHAVVERADACAPQGMSPALRSVHNHRGQVYDACATQLASIHPPRPLYDGEALASRPPFSRDPTASRRAT